MATVDWSSLKTKREWRRELTALLCRSDYACIKALHRVWDLQSDAEKLSGQALHVDDIGFNKVDFQKAKLYISKHERGSLDDDDIRHVRAMMIKYWRQLMELSKLKLSSKQAGSQSQGELDLHQGEGAAGT